MNVLNEQSRTADKGWAPAWGLGEVLTTPHSKNLLVAKQSKSKPRTWTDTLVMDIQEVGCGVMDWIELTQDRDRWRALVTAVMNLRLP